jgi:hypothetical protein
VLRQPLDPAGKPVTISRAGHPHLSDRFHARRRAESVPVWLLGRRGAPLRVQPDGVNAGDKIPENAGLKFLKIAGLKFPGSDVRFGR